MNILLYFLTPFFAGVIAIFLLMKFSERTHFLVDVPEGGALKIHTKSVPLVGGLAMLLAIGAGLAVFWGQISALAAGMLLAMAPVFLLGLYDDLAWKRISTIKPLLKFALLLLCAFISAVLLSVFGVSFDFVPVAAVSLILGFAYIFVCINAVNYQDGMDGLAGGQVLISLAGFFLLGLADGNLPALLFSLVVAGAVLAFLAFNLPPAKIFMGDSGAYLLGFVLAALSMLFVKPYDIASLLSPILIVGMPIFDGVFTNIRRLAAGKSIFLGDRGHVYDRLLQRGFSAKTTLVICYGLQVAAVIIGVIIYQ